MSGMTEHPCSHFQGNTSTTQQPKSDQLSTSPDPGIERRCFAKYPSIKARLVSQLSQSGSQLLCRARIKVRDTEDGGECCQPLYRREGHRAWCEIYTLRLRIADSGSWAQAKHVLVLSEQSQWSRMQSRCRWLVPPSPEESSWLEAAACSTMRVLLGGFGVGLSPGNILRLMRWH